MVTENKNSKKDQKILKKYTVKLIFNRFRKSTIHLLIPLHTQKRGKVLGRGERKGREKKLKKNLPNIYMLINTIILQSVLAIHNWI